MARGRPNAAGLYAISRRTYGWTVRLVRSGVRHERSFSDRAYGGRERALRSARDWRDAMLVLHPPPQRRERAQRPRRRRIEPAAGPAALEAGVTPELDRRGRIRLWRAKTYLGEGRVLQKTFSIARWGAEAEPMARAERRRQLELMRGRRHPHPAEPALRARALARPPVVPLPQAPAAADVVRSTNTSGYAGVVLRKAGSRRYWTAQTAQGGEWVSRSFSIARYGEEVALLLALMERQAQRGEVDRARDGRDARPAATGRSRAASPAGSAGGKRS